MRSSIFLSLLGLAIGALSVSCVDPVDQSLFGRVNVVVVDGTITNLAETQIITLNRSQSDPFTGLVGSIPLTRAVVEVVVDSGQVVTAYETSPGTGTYQLPSNFRGQIGHAYQLRFTLSDGTRYQSTQQIMPDVPPITKVRAQFNPTSFPAQSYDGSVNLNRGAHEFYLDAQDPADQHNYYRWDWTLYERQYWCRTCQLGVYSVYKVLPNTYRNAYYFVTGSEIYEDCFTPPTTPATGQIDYNAPGVPGGSWAYDYNCRTECWEILRNNNINLLDDLYSNGGQIVARQVAQIPYYQRAPCLVDIRQTSLTRDAYLYYKLFYDQTQNSGGLAAAPPTALIGNVHNVSNDREAVVGYFSATAIAVNHYWLDRKDAQGSPVAATDEAHNDLFYALNKRLPYPEPPPPYTGNREEAKVRLWPDTDRPPTALCIPSGSKSPLKPEGWRD